MVQLLNRGTYDQLRYYNHLNGQYYQLRVREQDNLNDPCPYKVLFVDSSYTSDDVRDAFVRNISVDDICARFNINKYSDRYEEYNEQDYLFTEETN